MNPNALKTIINGLMAKISSSSKKDWNENDSQSTSYIKNRPFYSEFVTIKSEISTNRETATSSNENFSIWYLQNNYSSYNWSELNIENDTFEILIQEQEKINFSFEDLIKTTEDCYIFGNPAIFAWYELEDFSITKEEALQQYNLDQNTSLTDNGKNYCIYIKDSHLNTLIIEKQYPEYTPVKLFLNQNKEKIYQIDKKYIPEAIARTSQLPKNNAIQLIPEVNDNYDATDVYDQGNLGYVVHNNQTYLLEYLDWEHCQFRAPNGNTLSVSIDEGWTEENNSYIYENQLDTYEFITTADIDTICGASIVAASEVTF